MNTREDGKAVELKPSHIEQFVEVDVFDLAFQSSQDRGRQEADKRISTKKTSKWP